MAERLRYGYGFIETTDDTGKVSYLFEHPVTDRPKPKLSPEEIEAAAITAYGHAEDMSWRSFMTDDPVPSLAFLITIENPAVRARALQIFSQHQIPARAIAATME